MGLKQNVPFWRIIEQAAPAVAVEHSFRRLGDATVRIVSIAFTLVTDANVANRSVRLEATDGTTIFWRGGSASTQTAGLTVRYSVFAGVGTVGDVTSARHIPLPSDGLVMLPGWQLNTVVNNIQVGDQWSLAGLLVEEFPNGPAFEWVPGGPAHLWERS